MKDILILGGGFAGVWSAASAIRLARNVGADRREIRVRMISAGDDLIIRPRLYEPQPDNMRVPLDRLLGPIGVNRINASVTAIDVNTRTVTARDFDGSRITANYDRLVLTSGSQLVRPALPGTQHIFDIDTIDAAIALDAHLAGLPRHTDSAGRYTAVVVGAGFTGLELATELATRLRDIAGHSADVRIVLVERAEVCGPELGDAPRSYIEEALDNLQIERRLGRTVVAATADTVTLSDGEIIPTATVVWTAGMAASPLTSHVALNRDPLGRVYVDRYMRVADLPTVYAAGDTAHATGDDGRPTVQSCQHAQQMGKCAGHNAAADLLDQPMLTFAADPYSTCVDLGTAGAITTSGCQRVVTSAGRAAKATKQEINTQLIYPPTDSAEALLAKAAHFSNSA